MWERAGEGNKPAPCSLGDPTHAMLILCRVGAQSPTEAEEGACLGECPGTWFVVHGWAHCGLGADQPWGCCLCAFPQWT